MRKFDQMDKTGFKWLTTSHREERDTVLNWLEMGSAAGGLKVIGEEGELWLLISTMLSMKCLHLFFFFCYRAKT